MSALFMFTKTPLMFYSLRFALGLAEAGFFPGIILYLTYWYPSERRARMISLFMTAIPISGMLRRTVLRMDHAVDGGRQRLARLAVAVRRRGPACGRARRRDAVLSGRQHPVGEMVDRGRKGDCSIASSITIARTSSNIPRSARCSQTAVSGACV